MKLQLQISLKRVKKNIFYRALVRFIANSNHIRSDAIAYSLVLSIIPLLTVFIKYAEVDQDTIRSYIAQLLAAYGMPDSSEIILVLDGILKRADAIAGIGSLFAIFGATNALRHLETAFNSIYRAKSRAMLYRFSLHISAIIIIPGLFLILGSSIVFIFRSIEPPRFMSMTYSGENIWIANNRGYILRMLGGSIKKINLKDKIETGAPFRNLYFNTDSGRSGRDWEMNITADQENITASDFLRIKKIAAADEIIYVISDNGIVFFSEDEGSNWNFNILNIISKNSIIHKPFTEDLFLDKNKNIYILTTTAAGSLLIKKTNSGDHTIAAFSSIFTKIHYLETGNKFYNPGFYLSGNGIISYSEDGRYWSRPFAAQYGNRKPRINTIISNQKNKIFFAGNNSALWYNEDGINRFPDVRSMEKGGRQSIRGLLFITEDRGLLYGSDNLLRITVDGGKTWLYPENKILSSFSFLSHKLVNDHLLIVGEKETLLSLKNPVLSKTLDKTGKPMIHFDITVLNTRSSILSFMYNILAYIVIFLLFFIFFTPLYLLLPNASVKFTAAVSGAVFTSMALLLFLIAIRLWWMIFSKSAYIYGIWAVVPVGMLMLLIFLQIVLFGLDLSYLIQKDHNRKMKALALSGGKYIDEP